MHEIEGQLSKIEFFSSQFKIILCNFVMKINFLRFSGNMVLNLCLDVPNTCGTRLFV